MAHLPCPHPQPPTSLPITTTPLPPPANHTPRSQKKRSTHTLAAHLVTLRPSFKQSSSAVPLFSVLHCIKSSLYFPHLAPMKKLALSSGAELAPTSCTAGIESGSGVVSMSVDWENLRRLSAVARFGGRSIGPARGGGERGTAGEERERTWPGVRTWWRLLSATGVGWGMSGCVSLVVVVVFNRASCVAESALVGGKARTGQA